MYSFRSFITGVFLIVCSAPLSARAMDYDGAYGFRPSEFSPERSLSQLTMVDAVPEHLYPFYHGVASGDPLEDRVIIWTRVTPDSLNTAPVTVSWKMATDTALANVVASGEIITDSSRDYTVKVDVDGLNSGMTYYYGFTALGLNSLTGKTKTTPTAAAADHLKFGVAASANFQAGYFNAYGRLADRTDLDAVIHLGNYVYEYPNYFEGNEELWEDRLYESGNETVTLFDYRARYSTHRLDDNLRRLHQQHPVIGIWNDHESANDSYAGGARNHQADTEGEWETRKNWSRQAYLEWMPVRESRGQRIYRTIQYGRLADLIMLDGRLEGRDKPINSINNPDLFDPDLTMLGAVQKAWLFEELKRSTATWKVIGQQVVFSPFNIGWAGAYTGRSFADTENLFLDVWDGYPAERREIIDFIRTEGLKNIVMLAGDFNSSYCFEVTDEPNVLDFRPPGPDLAELPFYDPSPNYDPATGAGAVGVEFTAPSITTANFDERFGLLAAAIFQAQLNMPLSAVNPPGTILGNPNPHMKYNEVTSHGYFVLDLRANGVQADYFYSPITGPATEENFGRGYRTERDTSFLTRAQAASPPKTVQDVPAPSRPPAVSTATLPVMGARVLSLYPNPALGQVQIQYTLRTAGHLTVSLLEVNGREVRRLVDQPKVAGVHQLRISLEGLPAGTFLLRMATSEGVTVQRLVKR